MFYLPFRYDDFSELRQLRELVADEKQSARATLTDVKFEKGFGRRPQRVIAQLRDEAGDTAEAIWFGRRFVENRLHAGDELLLSGKVQMRGWRPQFLSPEFSPAGRESIHTGRVVPVYPLVWRRYPEARARAAGAHPRAGAAGGRRPADGRGAGRAAAAGGRPVRRPFPRGGGRRADGARPACLRRAAGPAADACPGARGARRSCGLPE